jgi:hypothetical protein
MDVKEKVLRAFRQFMSKDSYLLMAEANERSLTHRLAIYIEQEFPDYDVDCEFQKNGTNTKKLERFSNPEAVRTGTVYPDIIVHHRGTDDNFIVIESKPSSMEEPCKKSSDCNCDHCKLWAYQSELGYRHAFYVVFPVRQKLKSFTFRQIEDFLFEVVEDPCQQCDLENQ